MLTHCSTLMLAMGAFTALKLNTTQAKAMSPSQRARVMHDQDLRGSIISGSASLGKEQLDTAAVSVTTLLGARSH